MPDPFVKWKEQYGSAALNQKFVGIISPGVYLGYDVSLSGTPDSVDVSTPASGRSVAVIQRDGFSITVVEESTITLEVPATNQLYHVVVEAQYQVGQATTSQLKVVADGSEASHHVIVGSVERSGGDLQQPTETYREDRVPRGGFSEVVNALQVVNAGDADSIQAGLLGDRPPAGEEGRLWLAITERAWYWDDGTEWRGIGSAKSIVLNKGGAPSIQAGLLADRPAAGTEGRLYVSIDEPRLYRDTGSAWEAEGLTTEDLTQPIRNKLKLSVDTAPAENIQSNQATFVAQVLSLIFDSASVFWRYGKSGTGLGKTFDKGDTAVKAEKVSASSVEFSVGSDLQNTLTESGNVVRGVAIGGGFVAYGGQDDNTHVHDVETGTLEHILTEPDNIIGNIRDIAIGGRFVAYGGQDDDTYVYDVETGTLERTLKELSGTVYGVAIGGGFVAYGGQDNNTYVHDLETGTLEHTLTESGNVVRGVAIGGGFVAYGGSDNNTHVHDLQTGTLEHTLTESSDDVNGVAIGSGFVAYGGQDNNTYVHANAQSLLDPSTEYEYQAVVESNGEVREGQVQTFTTAS